MSGRGRRSKLMYAGTNRQRNNSRAWEQFMVERNGACKAFVIFTMGMDACARCRKPRSEHK